MNPIVTVITENCHIRSFNSLKANFAYVIVNNIKSSLGHLHLKVHSAFKILLVISPHFVWISSKNFSFFHFPMFHKFITWNLIEYLHTQDFQTVKTHLNIWMNILLFSFVYGCKQNKKYLNETKEKEICFQASLSPAL